VTSPTPPPTSTSFPDSPPEPRAEAQPIVILNPASNHGRAAKLRPLVETKLLGGRGELIVTQRPGDAERLAEEATRAGRPVVVVGGDGAIHEAGNGMLRAGAQTPLGVVPAGSGNDYAFRVARMPADIAQALELALTVRPIRVDAAKVNDAYVINAVGVGIDANCAATAERLKRFGMTGRALYMTSAIREVIFNYGACPTLDASFDDAKEPQRKYAVIAMSVGPTYGGGFKINPGADPQDGLLDVCVITKPAQLRALQLLPAVERGEHVGEPETRIFRAQHAILESATEVFAQIDGEISKARRFEVMSLPNALWLRRGA
jgi:diacylglycerol kinase (ATP)